MVVLHCGMPSCGYETPDSSDAIAIALLTNHNITHQVTAHVAAPATPRPRGPRLERPRIDMGVECETWNSFERRWDNFCRGSGIDAAAESMQLFQCATENLGDALLKTNPTITSQPVKDVLAAMKLLAIIPVSRGVKRAELVNLHQSHEEAFRAFAARVRGKAETCGFTLNDTCACGRVNTINYTNETIRDVLLTGISDLDIRREALGVEGTQLPTVNDVIGFVEGREMARNALPLLSNSAISSFKRDNSRPQDVSSSNSRRLPLSPQSSLAPSMTDRAKQVSCPDCHRNFSPFCETSRGWNRTAHERCRECFLIQRRRRGGNSRNTAKPIEANAIELEHFSQISTISSNCPPNRRDTRRTATPKVVVLQHHIFTAGEWRRSKFMTHPSVRLRVRIDGATVNPHIHRHPPPLVEVDAVTDSGAQSDVWSLKQFLAHGFSKDDLRPVSLQLQAANKSKIRIEGAFLAILEGKDPDGAAVSCRTMIYVSSDVNRLFLSFESLLSLGILPPDFPTIGATRHQRDDINHQPSPHSINAMVGRCSPGTEDVDKCSCPIRKKPPLRPSHLPFPCTPSNNEKMRDWLLNRFSSSTFNTCAHRPLPSMDGPPVEIHLDDGAVPRACHTAATIPLHWQDQVHEDLLRDEALGVIERVPYGETTLWCHRMVVTRKHDGRPRRTVDLSPLNRYCKREPFSLSPCSPHSWKHVEDSDRCLEWLPLCAFAGVRPSSHDLHNPVRKMALL